MANYFRKNHTPISGASQLCTIRFKSKLLEAKNKGRSPALGNKTVTPGDKEYTDSLATDSNAEDADYDSEREMEMLSQD